jgi:phosphoribosylcarboxyaminoimidazole (NCAIR) mutase
MAVNGGQKAALMAAEILALSDAKIAGKLDDYKKKSASKVTQANEVLGNVKYDFRVI